MADLEKIAEDLSSLTVLEAADLAKILEEKWGVSAAAPVAVAAVSGELWEIVENKLHRWPRDPKQRFFDHCVMLP